MPTSSFRQGQLYSRADVADKIDLPQELRHGGNWDTGYSQWNEEFFIFCNVGIAGTTGHDYPNRWDGKDLIWTGKTTSRKDTPFVKEMLSGARPVHLFWRGEARTPFTYAGPATAIEVFDEIPFRVRWAFENALTAVDILTSSTPVWHRGPPPATGAQTIVKEDGPTQLYLMTLEGPADAILTGLLGNRTAIKVGISNDPARRANQLNFGFPPGSLVIWRVHGTMTFPSAGEAFIAEGRALEALRVAKHWIGGEFAIVPTDSLARVLEAASS